ncbi:putative cyclic-di-GMP phosphodiesterase AdrB [compost metagenome]
MTIINLAKNLGMSVLAEGVEKEGQANVLKRMGCHLFQGYLYSKPLTLSQLVEAY